MFSASGTEADGSSRLGPPILLQIVDLIWHARTVAAAANLAKRRLHLLRQDPNGLLGVLKAIAAVGARRRRLAAELAILERRNLLLASGGAGTGQRGRLGLRGFRLAEEVRRADAHLGELLDLAEELGEP